MSLKLHGLIASFGLLCGCVHVGTERRIVDNAATALGGRARITTLSALLVKGEGTESLLGQDLTPTSHSRKFAITNYEQLIDLAGDSVCVARTQTPNFQFIFGQAPMHLVQGPSGDVNTVGPAGGPGTQLSVAGEYGLVVENYHHPISAVHAALDPASMLSNLHSEGNEDLIDVTRPNNSRFTMAIERVTGLPSRVRSRVNHAILGDVVVETEFSGYHDVDGIELPMRLTTTLDGMIVTEINVQSELVKGGTAHLSICGASQPAKNSSNAASAPTVLPRKLADGVWLLSSDGSNSVLAEFHDHVVMIEAPLNEAVTLAMLAKARELIPQKPVTKVVNTHYHYDHVGGIRAAVSQGLTVIAHRNVVPFLRDIIHRSHTIDPDALARAPKRAILQAVSDELTLSDTSMTIDLYAINNNPHVAAAIVAYFPKERLLVEADMTSPGIASSLSGPNLIENVARRRLHVDWVVPLHGSVSPYAALLKSAGNSQVSGR